MSLRSGDGQRAGSCPVFLDEDEKRGAYFLGKVISLKDYRKGKEVTSTSSTEEEEVMREEEEFRRLDERIERLRKLLKERCDE